MTKSTKIHQATFDGLDKTASEERATAQIADDIWLGGHIETLDPANPTAEAVAVKDGRILAVGKGSDVLNLGGAGTRRRSLADRYVMPGLVESHAHALWGSCRELFDIFVGYQASFDQLTEAVRGRAARTAQGELIVGGPWRLDMRGAMGACPRALLDQIAPSHMVVLQDTTQHSLWCNTRVLEAAGITSESPDIAGGVIERDPVSGVPSGILAENACGPVKKMMLRSEAQLREASGHFVKYFNSLGITAFKEPMAFEADLKAYRDADDRNELTLHMAAHLVRSSPYSLDGTPYEMLERLRQQYASPNLRTGFAKLFLDGVAPSLTASFLEPYLAETGYDAAAHDPDATLLIPPDELNETLIELDRRGFVTKMHCVGDNAARAGLNAIEAARKRNGNTGLRHEIAHCPFVTPADIKRFAALNAIAEVSPKIWFPNPVTAGQIAVLGRERVDRCHPIRDLLDAGAEVTYASDWPAAAPDANPWIGLAGMISRRDPTGRFPGAVGSDQAISLKEALPIFTINGARSLQMEDETGTLAAGKWADFIVLDEPLEGLPPEELAAISVAETHWKGKCVYSR